MSFTLGPPKMRILDLTLILVLLSSYSFFFFQTVWTQNIGLGPHKVMSLILVDDLRPNNFSSKLDQD